MLNVFATKYFLCKKKKVIEVMKHFEKGRMGKDAE